MSKYVYLFELDSVRKTDEEIIAGQNTLYKEIALNGNIVVMTFNQLVDSRAFYSIVKDKKYRENLIKLFENGAIKISRYSDIKTPVQYLIQALESEREFIFSALPIKYCQKRLIALVKRSLIYSDLSEICEYYTGKRDENDLIRLFDEVDQNAQKSNSSLLPINMEDVGAKNQALKKMKVILEELYWLLSVILRLSMLDNIYIYPKERSLYEKYSLSFFLNLVLEFDNMRGEQWNDAVEIIKNLKCYGEKSEERSKYLREIKKVYDEKKNVSPIAFQYAEAIVNNCYNYTCEMSICNVSKHYNIKELDDNRENRTTFKQDFQNRLEQNWNMDRREDRYLLEESNELELFEKMKELPNFHTAVRLTKGRDYEIEGQEVYCYEYKMKESRKNYKHSGCKKILVRCIWACLAGLIAYGISRLFGESEFLWQMLTGQVADNILDLLGRFLVHFMLYAVTIIVLECITALVKKCFKNFMTVSEALYEIRSLCVDILNLLFGRANTYYNTCAEQIPFAEEKSNGVMQTYTPSLALKRYEKIRREETDSPLFSESDVYSLISLTESNKKELTCLEELYGYSFGIAYESRYNTMMVDPVRHGGNIIAYERVVPSTGKAGVVMLVYCHEKYILLKQYRHAVRMQQYNFPRGFAEPGRTPEENAKRELKEEIGVDKIRKIKEIGRISADSGLTSSRTYVYYVEIDGYKGLKNGHEGIKEIIEVNENELLQMIQNNWIEDGFTLGAYMLHSLSKH